MKTNNSKITNNLCLFESLSVQEATNILGGGWVYRIVKKLVQVVRDGIVYDTIVEVGTWVYDNINDNIEQTETDRKRIEQGYTHIGGRQPWL